MNDFFTCYRVDCILFKDITYKQIKSKKEFQVEEKANTYIDDKRETISDDLVQFATKDYNQSNVNVQFKTGDTIEVYARIKEGEKERIQVFKGLILKIQGFGAGRSFTVRKIANGIGVERTFPFNSPAIEKVKVISYGHIRRSRLYYIRKLKGKAARITFELAHSDSSSKSS